MINSPLISALRAPAGSHLLLLLREGAANLVSARWIYGRITLLDVTNDPFFIDDKSSAGGEALGFVVDAIGLRYCALEVAEERKGYPYLFGKGAIGGEAVNTDAQNLRLGCVEFGDIRLIRL
jgi:hypothetical protein